MRPLCPTSSPRHSFPNHSSPGPNVVEPRLWHGARTLRLPPPLLPSPTSLVAAGCSTAEQQQQQQQQQRQQQQELGRGMQNGRHTCRLYDLHDLVIPYQQAWDWQHKLVDEALASAAKGQDSDCLLLLQHAPVYTLGSGSTLDNLLFDPASSTIPLYRTERGGQVTYHGPGQLVMYPILNLQRRPHRQDLHWYMRSLEQVVINALGEAVGLEAQRVEGLTGVWVDGHKVAAIGVRAKRWVTYHGLALNVVTDLAPFKAIVPCGIADRPVGSVSGLLQRTTPEGSPWHMPAGELMLELRCALLDEFAKVFELELQEVDPSINLPGFESSQLQRPPPATPVRAAG